MSNYKEPKVGETCPAMINEDYEYHLSGDCLSYCTCLLNDEQCVGIVRVDDDDRSSEFFSRARNRFDEEAINRCPMYGVSAETIKQFIIEKANTEMEKKIGKIHNLKEETPVETPKEMGAIEKISQELKLSKMLKSVLNHKTQKVTDKDDYNNKKLFATEFFVEATSDERSSLWRKYAQEWQKHSNDYPDYDKLDWQEDLSGFGVHLGNVFSRGEILPVYVSFSFAKIEGKQICFYTSDSMVTDHQMVEDFIVTNFPVKYDSGSRRAMTNATNFHHCVGFCKK